MDDKQLRVRTCEHMQNQHINYFLSCTRKRTGSGLQKKSNDCNGTSRGRRQRKGARPAAPGGGRGRGVQTPAECRGTRRRHAPAEVEGGLLPDPPSRFWRGECTGRHSAPAHCPSHQKRVSLIRQPEAPTWHFLSNLSFQVG